MKIYERDVQNLMVKSKLPDADWVINPYIGCTHNCRYCYGVFMRRFCKCTDPWGEFLIVKNGKLRNQMKILSEQVILIGSVTDAYQPIEKHYRRTRAVLEALQGCDARIEILTKSKLILDDLPLLQSLHHVRIGVSLNTMDDAFQKKMEPGASGVEERIQTLRELKKAGIETYLFVSPIFPMITDLEEIIVKTKDYVDFFCFENLNLRGSYKTDILKYIHDDWSQYECIYHDIYIKGDKTYWEECKKKIVELAEKYGICVKEYFYHDQIKKK